MEYNPGAFLRAERSAPDSPAADLIILNQPLQDFKTFKRVWSHTKYRICADGGANRLYDMLSGALEQYRTDFLPDLIHGDLDSLKPEISKFYQDNGVTISKDDDQYSTDFGKCMKIITNGYPPDSGYSTPNETELRTKDPSPQDIIILSTLAGRVDQGLGLLHELLRESLKPHSSSPVRLWLISEQSISFLLQPGDSKITDLSSENGIFTKNIGILPIYGAATISTKGLEWDVQDWKTEMGGMVSTSNHVLGDEVDAVTTKIVLFTIERVKSE